MAVFDVSFLNKNLQSSTQDYGFLVDQIDIMRNRLESDGHLSPGDYDLLIEEAQKVYSHPGLTPSQRSNIDVKISQFQELKEANKRKDNQDIARLNREMKDTFLEQNMLLSNDPDLMLQARTDAYRVKLDRLTTAIDNLEASGQDVTEHYNEFNSTINEFNDLLAAQDAVAEYKGGEPKAQMVSFITTNARGEITNIQFGRVGSQSGYVETNGVYGGMKVYGKVNRKENGKNIFQLGNTTFSAPDVAIPDPNNPLAFRNAPLLSENQRQQRGRVETGQIGEWEVIDPAQIQPQSSIPTGGYARGSNGFIYERLPTGGYRKFVDAKLENLGISENEIIPIPRSFEQKIIPNVTETVDGSQPFQPPTPADIQPAAGIGTSTTATDQTKQQPAAQATHGGVQRSKDPTQRLGAGQRVERTLADRAIGAAKGLINRIGKLF